MENLVKYKLELDHNYHTELTKYRDICANAVIEFLRDHMIDVQNSNDCESLLNTLNNICTSLRIDTFCIPSSGGLSVEQYQVQLDVRIAEFCTYQRHFSGKILPLTALLKYLNKDPSSRVITMDDVVASIGRLNKLSADYKLIPKNIRDHSKQYLCLGDTVITENVQRILQFFSDSKWSYLTIDTLTQLSGWSEDMCKKEIYYMQNKGQILVDLQDMPYRYYLNVPLSTQLIEQSE